MSEAFERVRDALETRGARFSGTRQNHFMATCPHHDDKNPSLGVDDKGDRVLVRCYADCHTDDVVAAMGLTLRDLFDGDLDAIEHGQVVRSYLYERSNGDPWFWVDRLYPKSFRQRLPGTERGDREAYKRGLQGREPILYRAPRTWRAMQAGNATVWLVDGEKDVEACERVGLVATCPPGGGKQWRDTYTQFLRRAHRVVIVADQDKEKQDGSLGPGHQFAVNARSALKAAGVKVRVVMPAFGKDAADHFAAGYGPDDFVPDMTCNTRPRGVTARELMTMTFEPLSFAVSRILPAGLAVLAGSPKAGKSWIALDLCLSVALGGPALGAIATSQGSALYLAREDTFQRLQSRMALLMSGTGEIPTQQIEVIPAEREWVGGEEGLANLTEWAEDVGNPRIVVIDTIAKVEPEMGETRIGGAYTGNYKMMGRYKQWADLHNCAVVMVHHDRKADSGRAPDGSKTDPFLRISGTRGITGAADTLWFLETEREKHEGRLHVTGRDVAEQTLELWKAGPIWQATHQPE